MMRQYFKNKVNDIKGWKKVLPFFLFTLLPLPVNAQFVAADSTETDTVETPAKKPGLGKRLINKLGNKYYYDKDLILRQNSTVRANTFETKIGLTCRL